MVPSLFVFCGPFISSRLSPLHGSPAGAPSGFLRARYTGYDPRLYNDCLLLELKGTMSEAELSLMRQRLTAGL